MFEMDRDAAAYGVIAVENRFIADYLPAAKGDYVKVYLWGLHACACPQEGLSLESAAQSLYLTVPEVEAALRFVPGLEEGCVLFEREKDRLWCFYTGEADEKQLKNALRERLARYMLPDVAVRLPEMPHTPSMKLDRRRLAQMMEQEAPNV